MALYSSLAQNKNQANGHVGDYQFKGYITNGGWVEDEAGEDHSVSSYANSYYNPTLAKWNVPSRQNYYTVHTQKYDNGQVGRQEYGQMKDYGIDINTLFDNSGNIIKSDTVYTKLSPSGGQIATYSPGDSGYDNVHKEVVDLIFTKQDGGTLAALNKGRGLGHPRSWTPVGGLAKPGKMKPLTPRGTLLPEVNVYPNKEVDFVFDGGMLPEVVVGDQTPTIDGGVLPEVTVEATKTPSYKKMFRPSVPSKAVGGPVEQSNNRKPWQGLLQQQVLPRTTADSIKNLPIDEMIENLPQQLPNDSTPTPPMEKLPYYPGKEDPDQKPKVLPYYPNKGHGDIKPLQYMKTLPQLQRRGGKLVEIWTR